MLIAETQGERALWAAVIGQLLTDYHLPETPSNRRERDEAHAWIQNRTREKDRVLMMAGVPVERFWEEAAKGFPAWRNRGEGTTIRYRSSPRTEAA